jgi:pyridoxal phosphate enzyme (YggS family)
MTGVSDRLADVRDRVAAAARRSGRRPEEVTIVGVSKTFSPDRIVEAAEAGLADFGENKAQEFAQKVEALENLPDLRWHFVGHLQRNKVKLVIGKAALFHALDSLRLAKEIEKVAARLAVDPVDCLIQVNVSEEETKFGVHQKTLASLAEAVAGFDRLRIRGLMTLAEPTSDRSVLHRQFGLLRSLGEQLEAWGHPDADVLSMGMSGDFEIAIEEGATIVRIGSSIFGPRACAVP